MKHILAKKYSTLREIFDFINQNHSFYTAEKLVDRANKVIDAKELGKMAMLRQSYGGLGKDNGFAGHINSRGNGMNQGTSNSFIGGMFFGIALVGLLRLLAMKGAKMHTK